MWWHRSNMCVGTANCLKGQAQLDMHPEECAQLVESRVRIPMYADFAVNGRPDMHDVVTRHINLSQIDEAYKQLVRGEVIRLVITEF